MTDEQSKKCHAIIHSAATAAAGVGGGLAQTLVADAAVIVPIQTAMVISLGKVFDRELTDAAAKATVMTVLATTIGKTAAMLFVKWIPILGNLANASVAFSVTETLGWRIAEDFDKEAIRSK